MSTMMGAWRTLGQDASVLKQKVKPGTAKRMLRFAVPYTRLLAMFLVVVTVDAGIGIVNPLIFRQIINNGILKGNAGLIIHLAVIVAVLGIFDGALGMTQTFLASKIGAEIVLSLRTKLFEHIQRMPLAFFTRTQTGALVSRLNTDVGGARTAFTDILSNVVGNLITVALILGAMFVLSWRITLGSAGAASPLRVSRALLGTQAPSHHARELRSDRRHEQPHGRALQRRRCASRQALRPPSR